MNVLRVALPLSLVSFLSAAAAAEKIDFSRDVLPILSANCFKCHGRDESSREAKLRLDVRDNAIADHKGFFPIVPGKSSESELMLRITSTDDEELMPPADKGRKLYPAEAKIIKEWIDQGAEYTEHWAFLPPKKAPLPTVAAASWPQQPIDHFILQRLEQKKLKPAGHASAETMIRRATLDLIGLPPTPEETAAFVADKSPDAYAKLVERLLASPHYGERWGRHWLDVARYADSGGFETDLFFGHAFRYRDYVIRSFNADKPFDRFIKEQIAGDELFPGDQEARIATGLYTTGPVLQEAGMVTGKLEYDQLTDAVDTTGAAFVGMTFACARCHDHKYDPVSQKEYYNLQAVFAASDQVDFAADGTKIRDRAALKTTLKEFEAEQARERAKRELDPIRRDESLRKTGDAFIEADPELKAHIDATKRYNIIQHAVERYQRALSETGKADAAPDLLGEEEGDDNNVIALKAVLAGVLHAKPASKAEAALLNVGMVTLLNPPPRGAGGGGRRRPAPAVPGATPAADAGAAGATPPDALPEVAPAAIDAKALAPTGDVAAAPAAVAGAPVAAAAQRPAGRGGMRGAFNALKTDEEKRQFLLDLGKAQLDQPKPANYVADIDALRKATGEKHLYDASPIPDRFLAHRDTPFETHLLKRGELDMPGEIVGPGVPEKIAAGTTFENVPPEKRRSVLAEWIASDKNLLTARVIVNRVWQWHFGEGIVRTPNDFGISGERPTHPELLDWLAVEFVEHGWSIKHLHRLIMLSSTYQMLPTADRETLEADPSNYFFTRFQPHRLEAEIIWDNIRAVTGKLDLKMYGLPIAPPLDEQEQLGNYRKWPASTPEEANRRAIYILVKRSFRFPMLSAFDLPDNITSCGRRDITTVPNQALTLMNNSTMKTQAAAFADRLLSETNGNLESVPARAWSYAYGRTIAPEEKQQVTAFLTSQPDKKNAVAELCLAIFNTNEFIYLQ